ncbi:MAG: hypothetical protein M0C28_27980, partial [Candidatus Moduliflexus flocculans]|nr:hypothetical protein [Candidatus Moduliflexus flocculans]
PGQGQPAPGHPPRRDEGSGGPGTRSWPPPSSGPRTKGCGRASTPTRSASTATPPGRRSGCGTGRAACPGDGRLPALSRHRLSRSSSTSPTPSPSGPARTSRSPSSRTRS